MALSGRIKIKYGENYLSLHRKELSIDYMKYHGEYDALIDEYETIKKIIKDNQQDIDLLMESYDNRKDLKE